MRPSTPAEYMEANRQASPGWRWVTCPDHGAILTKLGRPWRCQRCWDEYHAMPQLEENHQVSSSPSWVFGLAALVGLIITLAGVFCGGGP